MKLREFYKKVVDTGIKNDPRSSTRIKELLKKKKTDYDKLPAGERNLFDTDSLWNPYADTRLFCVDDKINVKNIMAGIDVETSEVLLFDRLRNKHKLDLLLGHHPEGRAFANFYEVMDLQVDIMHEAGMSLSLSEQTVAERKKEVERRVMPANFTRPVDAARLLDVPFLCVHTPSDNCVYQFLKKYFNKSKPRSLQHVVELLLEIPEYKEAAKNNSGPRILLGDKTSRTHRIFYEMTGGTEGPKVVYEHLAKQGYDTVVAMHMSEEHFKKARDAKINVVIAGHISSDTLGLNILLDSVEQKGAFNIIECSGFKRFRRKK